MSTLDWNPTDGLVVENVVKRFGGHLVLDDVNLRVQPKSIHAVIGPNGAGKSTLFGVIAGEHTPDRGRIILDGTTITRYTPSRRVRAGVARAFQVAHIFPDLTVLENVVSAVLATRRHARRIRPSKALTAAREVARAGLEQTGLDTLADSKAHDLSQGDRKRLEIAVTLQLHPTLLLLDEPTAGMSPEETASTVELIRSLWSQTGLTVLLTEHDMNVVFGLAQCLTVLAAGHILVTGEPSEVRSRTDVRDVYLGRDDDTA